MTYQNLWWHPNYKEYGSGLNLPKTWPTVQEQYRKPHFLHELRHYDIPTENYQSPLYYRYPRMGKPVYRATFRDKPHCVQAYYPEGDPKGQPEGFHGRMYYEQGPPQFKYEGRPKNELYWLERAPMLPNFPNHTKAAIFDPSGSVNQIQSSVRPPPIPSGNSIQVPTKFGRTLPYHHNCQDFVRSSRKLSPDTRVGYL